MNVAPLEPAAPVLEAVDQTSARVHFTRPPVRPGAPPHTCVVVSIGMLRDGSSEWKPVDSKTSTLSEGRAHAVSSTSALMKGLVAGATYRANIIVKNAHGPGPSSNTSEGASLRCLMKNCTLQVKGPGRSGTPSYERGPLTSNLRQQRRARLRAFRPEPSEPSEPSASECCTRVVFRATWLQMVHGWIARCMRAALIRARTQALWRWLCQWDMCRVRQRLVDPTMPLQQRAT